MAPLSISDSVFQTALRRARRGEVDDETGGVLLRGSRRASLWRELREAASTVRDRSLGRELLITAHVHMIAECKLPTACQYCSLSSRYRSVCAERDRLTARELVRAVRYSEQRGVQSIVLVGGCNPAGSDAEVRRAVERVRQVSDIDLAIDVGPFLSSSTIRWLKHHGVPTVYCSLETSNPAAFREAKPGDSLEERIACMERVEREGSNLGNVVMNGLGNSEDLLRSILALRRFRRLSHLYLSTFQPVRGTPWADRRPGSIEVSLRALAIARLALPGVHLGLAEVEVEDPGSAARLSRQLRAGAGNTLAGVLVYKRKTVDNVVRIRDEATAMGFHLPRSRPAAPSRR